MFNNFEIWNLLLSIDNCINVVWGASRVHFGKGINRFTFFDFRARKTMAALCVGLMDKATRVCGKVGDTWQASLLWFSSGFLCLGLWKILPALCRLPVLVVCLDWFGLHWQRLEPSFVNRQFQSFTCWWSQKVHSVVWALAARVWPQLQDKISSEIWLVPCSIHLLTLCCNEFQKWIL